VVARVVYGQTKVHAQFIQVDQLWQTDRSSLAIFKGRGHFEAKS